MADYIPKGINEFYVWQGNFHTRVSEKLTSFKIDAEKLIPVTEAQSKYELAFKQSSNPDATNRSDRVERNKRTAEYKAQIRAFVNESIRYNSDVTDYDRKYLGLTIPSGTRVPASVPTTIPEANVDFSQRLQHTLYFRDQNATSKAKPKGVHGCEIWYKVGGEAPVSVSELTYVDTDTRSPFVIKFDGEDRGKIVYYWLRWVNSRNEVGPWSKPVSGAIVG